MAGLVRVRCPTCGQPAPLASLGKRRCARCKLVKVVAAFRNTDGYCKLCRAAYNLGYKATPPASSPLA
jgi:hypothetical protein